LTALFVFFFVLFFSPFFQVVKDRNLDPCFSDWLFGAFDLNDDKILSFKDWALCFDRCSRGTARETTMIAMRVLGEPSDAPERAKKILEHLKKPITEVDCCLCWFLFNHRL
jgi:hypothetical protein